MTVVLRRAGWGKAENTGDNLGGHEINWRPGR